MNLEHLIARAPNLHAPSETVVRLLGLLNTPDADYDEVVATVKRDAVLSAKLLAICNSATYSLARPVASIKEALHYLGYGEIHRLVMALNFGSQISTGLPGYDIEEGGLWRHSLVTALLTPRVSALSKKSGPDTSIAYTAGLLHDIGKLVIGQTLDPRSRVEIHRLVDAEGASLLQAEKAVVGFDHAEIGAGLLRQWRIPEVIAAAVAFHHNPPIGSSSNLAAAVHVADSVAHQSGASPGRVSFAVVRRDDVFSSLGLTGEDLQTLMMAAFEAQDTAKDKAPRAGLVPTEATAGDGLDRSSF